MYHMYLCRAYLLFYKGGAETCYILICKPLQCRRQSTYAGLTIVGDPVFYAPTNSILLFYLLHMASNKFYFTYLFTIGSFTTQTLISHTADRRPVISGWVLVLARKLTQTFWSSLFTKMVETHKKRKKYSNYKITLTIGNGEHIKHTLSISKHDPHQQHLPKISQNVSGAVRMAIRYERNICTVR